MWKISVTTLKMFIHRLSLLALITQFKRSARWNFELIHRKCKEHIVPDFLSRSVSRSSENIDDVYEVPCYHQTSDKGYHKMLKIFEGYPKEYPCWRVENGDLYKLIHVWKIVVHRNKRREAVARCPANLLLVMMEFLRSG